MLARRYSVVTYGNRDGYHVPFALQEAGALSHILTDFYSPDWLVRLARRFPTLPLSQKIQARSHSHISSSSATNCFLAKSLFGFILQLRGIPANQRDRYLDSFLSRVALKHAMKHPGEALLCYSYYWESIARSLPMGRISQPIYFFQVHPCVSQIQDVVQADRALTGLSYLPEPEEVFPRDLEESFIQCLRNSSGVIAASSFTLQGLVDRGVDASHMRVVPYGAFDGEAIPRLPEAVYTDSRWCSQRPLRLLWVGQLAYRKAAHHLFAALRFFSSAQVQLTLVTRSAMPRELVALCPENVHVISNVTDSLKADLYRSHHLFVLPSLVEGFGLVYLEALAAGLPILASLNSGAPDIISHGVHGFIVEAGIAESIRDVIDACLSDSSLLPAMSFNGISLSRSLTWSRFREGIRQSLSDFELASTG
jgi:glycosyltransferase involved in cell wall biosynthesis